MNRNIDKLLTDVLMLLYIVEDKLDYSDKDLGKAIDILQNIQELI